MTRNETIEKIDGLLMYYKKHYWPSHESAVHLYDEFIAPLVKEECRHRNKPIGVVDRKTGKCYVHCEDCKMLVATATPVKEKEYAPMVAQAEEKVCKTCYGTTYKFCSSTKQIPCPDCTPQPKAPELLGDVKIEGNTFTHIRVLVDHINNLKEYVKYHTNE